MLTKSNHWRYEKEWRLVRDVKDGLIYSYPEELLACVIFGAKMDEPRQKLLNIFDEKLRIPEIFEVKLCERRFALRIKPISKAL